MFTGILFQFLKDLSDSLFDLSLRRESGQIKYPVQSKDFFQSLSEHLMSFRVYFFFSFFLQRGKHLLNDIVNKTVNYALKVLTFHHFSAFGIDYFSLLIHNIIKLKELFSDVKILLLNTPLCILNGSRNQLILNSLALIYAHFVH